MIVYHGTTRRRTERICSEGFLPRKPSRRVWFAKSRAYAQRRAKTQGRRSHDRPVVLTCDLNLNQLRSRLGPKRVRHRGGVVAIDARVPPTVLRSHPDLDQPRSPKELADWVNHLLGLKPYKGVSRSHPGIERLSRWAVRRAVHQSSTRIAPQELLQMACQWLPEFFRGVEIDFDRLQVYHRAAAGDLEVAPTPVKANPREAEALDCLDASNPRRRMRGLSMLAEMKDPDLFDWCMMHLGDESRSVRVAALHTMLDCDDVEPEMLAPLAESRDKRIRAAALAVLAKHAGADAHRWFQRALRDPSPCVRVEAARLLSELDPARHRSVFEVALRDPNPEVARLAEGLTAGKGYATTRV